MGQAVNHPRDLWHARVFLRSAALFAQDVGLLRQRAEVKNTRHLTRARGVTPDLCDEQVDGSNPAGATVEQ